MKNEILARALGELDDDLIEEAHRPFPKVMRKKPVLQRYAVLAACIALIFAAAFGHLTGGTPSVSINGTDISVQDGQPNSIELPLAATMQLRAVSGTEIPLSVSPAGKTLHLTAGSGSILLHNCEEHSSLSVSAADEIVWLVDTTAQSDFYLTLSWGHQSARLTATANPDTNALILSFSIS